MNLYFPIINLLRGLAAFLVCCYHFTNYEGIHGSLLPEGDALRSAGELGVNGVFIFFVISGMVIPISMYKGKYTLQRLPRFIARRWVRIEIPYIASIFMMLFVMYLFALKNDTGFTFDFIRFLHHLLYTIPFTDYEWYNVIYWTLAIEFQYYLIIAVLYPLLSSNYAWLRYITLLVFASSGLLLPQEILVFHYAPLFAMGIVLYLNKINRISELLLYLSLLFFAGITWYAFDWIVMTFVLLTALIIVHFNVDNKLSNWLGKISYSLYLIHGVIGGNVIYLLARYADSYTSKLFVILAGIVASFLVSYVFWKIVEAPSKKLSKKIDV